MRQFVIAALLGAISYQDAQAVLIKSYGAPEGAAAAADAAAAKAGVAPSDDAVAKKQVESQQADEAAEAAKHEAEQAARRKAIQDAIQKDLAEEAAKANKGKAELTPEQKAAETAAKIKATIEKAKAEADAAKAKANAAEAVAAAAEEAYRQKVVNEQNQRTKDLLKASGIEVGKSLATLVKEAEDDEMVDINDAFESDDEDKSDLEFEQEYETGDENDIQQAEDDMSAGSASDADDEDVQDGDTNAVMNLAQAQAMAKKGDAHLHETDMRVDPPLLDEGKRSIAAAEKELEERKTEYDKFKKFAEEKELAFHAAARVSKAARENRAKAEDRYYIASKAARKAMRYAENMEREAKFAAARQAAHDKYNEVIAAANKEASARDAAKAALYVKKSEAQSVVQNTPAANATAAVQTTNTPAANATAPALAVVKTASK